MTFLLFDAFVAGPVALRDLFERRSVAKHVVAEVARITEEHSVVLKVETKH